MIKYGLYLFLLSLYISGCQSGTTTELGKDKADHSTYSRPPVLTSPQRITSVPIPEEVYFAGEKIPLERADVREALEHELIINTFRQSNTLKIIKNIERWRPFVSSILREMEVPEDFLYLAVAESEFDNTALSYAGAMGMWQIMESTGKDYGLKINKDVDMRRDPKLSTIVACKFLKNSYKSFNNWTLTAASYNVGVRGMLNRLEDQKADNFFDLHLNKETGRYVFRIIALKLILENPDQYGYHVAEEEKYKPYEFETIIVKEDIDNLVDFALQHETTYKELRLLNPWFNNTSNFKLKLAKKDSLEIRIPVKQNQQKILPQ